MTVLSWLPVGVGLRGTNYGGTEAEIIAWLDDFFTKMTTLDWTQTADTGQYEIGGGGKTYQGTTNGQVLAYRLYRFNDALVDTHPLFIKIEFRRNYSASDVTGGAFIQSVVTVGTATNGSGTINANAQSISSLVGLSIASGIQVSTLVSTQSFACSMPSKGFVGVVFNPGQHLSRYFTTPNNNIYHCDLAFFIERIPNSDGTPSATGFTLFGPNTTFDWGADSAKVHDYTNAAIMRANTKIFDGSAYSVSLGMPIFPQTFIMNDFLVNHFYHSVPTPVRSVGLAAIKPNMLGGGSQFSALVYGATDSNFISIPSASALRPGNVATEVAMLWE